MVEPSGASLVTASPPRPSQVMREPLPGKGYEVGQSPDLGDAQRDQAGVVRRWFVRACRWRGGAVGGLTHLGGGDRAGCEGDDGQDDVAQQRGVEADLAVVEAELVLADLEILLHRPSAPGDRHECGQGRRPVAGHVAVEERHLSGVFEAAAHK